MLSVRQLVFKTSCGNWVVAVNRSIKLTEKQWIKLQKRLREDHPLSVIAIRDKMKRVLGFTTREDRADYWNPVIHLDFFDEKMKTMFLLRYGDYLERR